MTDASAQIGVTGLAVMGRNLARNLARHGFPVALHNRSPERTRTLVAEHGDEGTFIASESMADFVASLERPRAIIIMVKAGEPTDAVIEELVPLLERDDIIIDCGNAHFLDTRRREAALREHGLHFVGSGVSGGEEGALLGPSIMPGGSAAVLRAARPDVRVDRRPGRRRRRAACTSGPDGAGHFVKMVHNGIEYADMQLIAEAYDLLRSGLGATPAEIAEIFRDWNGGELESFLIEISADVLAQVDAVTGQAVRRHRPRPGRAEGHRPLDRAERARARRPDHRHRRGDVRPLAVGSRRRSERRRGSRSRRPRPRRRSRSPIATRSSRTCAGPCTRRRSSPTRRASTTSRPAARSTAGTSTAGATATIWRGGCIIRARFLDRIKQAYDDDPQLPSLLVAPFFADAVSEGVASWRRVVTAAAHGGVPTPTFSSSLAYFDGLRRERLPAALIQGLRDNFGAHTYRRVDRDGSFHTLWAGDRSEHPA